jgi:hypothetical protein
VIRLQFSILIAVVLTSGLWSIALARGMCSERMTLFTVMEASYVGLLIGLWLLTWIERFSSSSTEIQTSSYHTTSTLGTIVWSKMIAFLETAPIMWLDIQSFQAEPCMWCSE